MIDLVKSAGWQKLEEALSYALGHRIRIEILCLLNEAVYSTAELTDHTPWSLPVVSYHVKELLNKGSIEIADVKKVRNVDQWSAPGSSDRSGLDCFSSSLLMG